MKEQVEQTVESKPEHKQQVKSAALLTLALLLIAAGFVTDGITEYGHHACFIIAGICIGIAIGRNHETNKNN